MGSVHESGTVRDRTRGVDRNSDDRSPKNLTKKPKRRAAKTFDEPAKGKGKDKKAKGEKKDKKGDEPKGEKKEEASRGRRPEVRRLNA